MGRPGLFIMSIPGGCIPSILVGNAAGTAEGRCGSTSTALPSNDTEVSGCYFAFVRVHPGILSITSGVCPQERIKQLCLL